MRPSTFKKKTIEIVLISAVTVTLLIAFLIPYSNVSVATDVSPDSSDGFTWHAQYILNDLILSLIYIFLASLWIAYLFLKNLKLKFLIRIFLIILSVFTFLLAIGNATMPIQDFVPDYGVYLSLFILPILAIYLIYSRRLHRSSK
jgi:hypothetical protein